MVTEFSGWSDVWQGELPGLTADRIGRNLMTVPALSFNAPELAARMIRAAAKRRGMPVSQFIKEAAEREATQAGAGWRVEEPNETTAAAILEPVEGLTQYRTVDEALRSVINGQPSVFSRSIQYSGWRCECAMARIQRSLLRMM
jgi:uncharacterized protein (DUF1778 family)